MQSVKTWMRTNRRFVLSALGAFAAGGLAGCGGGGSGGDAAVPEEAKPVGTWQGVLSDLKEDVRFLDIPPPASTVYRIEQGRIRPSKGLVDALSAAGPFTVFAPTNAAFAAALAELGVTKEALFANTELLTAVLTYHVVPSRVFKAQVPLNTPITTLQGATFTVGSDLAITDQAGRKANIVATDVMTSNGVIHVTDKVLLPADKNIVETAVAADPEFSILVEAVTAAGLANTLSTGTLTVFAPTNAAFAKLP